MKKITLIAIFLIVVCTLSFVRADMGLPGIPSYSVRVNKLEGIEAEDYNKAKVIIPYDTVLDVIYEYKQDGEFYLEVDYNDWTYVVKNSDVERVKNTFLPSDSEEEYEKEIATFYVIREGAYLYKGPSMTYDKVDGEPMINVGTTFVTEYMGEVWSYVTYNGYSGWVYTYTGSNVMSPYKISPLVARVYEESEVYTIKPVTLKDVNGKITAVIPKGVYATYKYVLNSYRTYWNVFLEYDTVSGWYESANNFELAKVFNNSTIYTTDRTTVYKEINDKTNKNIVGYVDANVECKVLYTVPRERVGDSWYYVETETIKGWVYESINYDDDGNYIEECTFLPSTNISFDNEYWDSEADKDLNVYDSLKGNLTNKIIKEDSNLSIIYYYSKEINEEEYEEWYFVKSGSIKGWVNQKLDFVVPKEEENKEEPTVVPASSSNTTEPTNNVPSLANENTPKKEELLNKSIYFCLGAALLAIIILVVIIVVNNKKNKKEYVINNEDVINQKEEQIKIEEK